MKRLGITLLIVGFLLCAGLFVVLLKGAQSPPPAYSPPRLAAIMATPTIDMNGTVIAFVVRASYQVIEHRPDGLITAMPVGSIEFDLKGPSGGSVLVGDTLYESAEIADALFALAMQERSKVHPGPLPQRRRALRVK